jgi:hypothetical protein
MVEFASVIGQVFEEERAELASKCRFSMFSSTNPDTIVTTARGINFRGQKVYNVDIIRGDYSSNSDILSKLVGLFGLPIETRAIPIDEVVSFSWKAEDVEKVLSERDES